MTDAYCAALPDVGCWKKKMLLVCSNTAFPDFFPLSMLKVRERARHLLASIPVELVSLGSIGD